MKRSILTEKISRRGYDIFREYTVDPLERFQVRDVMTRNPDFIWAKTPLQTLVKEKFSSAGHRGYPVLSGESEAESKIIGVITASDLARVTALEDVQKLTAQDLIQRPVLTIYENETCRAAADKMVENNIGRLIVAEVKPSGKLIGILTRSDLLKARYQSLKEESHRERVIAREILKPSP